MTADDPYDVLGLRPDATEADVARAYRREVRRHHPDTAGGDDPDERRRQLARVQVAYAVLRDAVRRAEDDHEPPQPPPPGGTTVPVTVVRRGRAPVGISPTAPDPPLRVGPVRWER